MADTESPKAAFKPAKKVSNTATPTKKKSSSVSSTPKKVKSDAADATEKVNKKTKSETTETPEKKIPTTKKKTPSPSSEESTPAHTVKRPKTPSVEQTPRPETPTSPKFKPSKPSPAKKIIKKAPNPQPEEASLESEPKIDENKHEIDTNSIAEPESKQHSDHEDSHDEDGHESESDAEEQGHDQEPESILESATPDLKPEESENDDSENGSDNDGHEEYSDHDGNEELDEEKTETVPDHQGESEDDRDHVEDKPTELLNSTMDKAHEASEMSGGAGPEIPGTEKPDEKPETADTDGADKADDAPKSTSALKDGLSHGIQSSKKMAGKAVKAAKGTSGVSKKASSTAGKTAKPSPESIKDFPSDVQEKTPEKKEKPELPRTPSISSEQGPHSLNIGVDIPLNSEPTKLQSPLPEKVPFTPSISALSQCRVNDSGEITDPFGNVMARATGDLEKISGKKLDSHGHVIDDSGKVVGKVSELLGAAKEYMESMARGLADKVVNGSGQVVDQYHNVCGRCEGDITEMIGQTVTRDGLVMSPEGDIAGYVAENFLLNGYPDIEEEKPTRKPSGIQSTKLPPSSGEKESGSQEGTVVGDDSEHPTDLFLNIQSTKEGISMTIRIPTGFLKGQAVESDIKV